MQVRVAAAQKGREGDENRIGVTRFKEIPITIATYPSSPSCLALVLFPPRFAIHILSLDLPSNLPLKNVLRLFFPFR